ncbi:MAG: DUF3810 domain-containing protein [Oscillospiraceae bacterium]|nr:DUF3810 domain-containing protein [Oscillospiraceae bacterium]
MKNAVFLPPKNTLTSKLSTQKKNRSAGRIWLSALPCLLLTPIGLLLTYLSTINAALTEKLWSSSVYPIIAQVVTAVTGLFPFSVAEAIIVFGGISLIISVIVFIVKLVRCKNQPALESTDGDETPAPSVRTARLRLCSRYFSVLLSIVSVGYFMFVLMGGINYNRLTFSHYSGLEVRKSSVEELTALCTYLAETTNELRQHVTEDENGVFVLSQDIHSTADLAVDAFSGLYPRYPIFEGRYSTPKPVFFSRAMSYADIAGIFIPMTSESNINVDMPDYHIPFTMCHEQTHLRGFMREDEANFIAYLACRTSGSIDFKYSGHLAALTRAMNALYGVDYDAFVEIYYTYCDGILRDYAANSEYWKQFEGPIAETSNKINDTYLKANNQSDGIRSYGRMLDLLLAEYRQNIAQ